MQTNEMKKLPVSFQYGFTVFMNRTEPHCFVEAGADLEKVSFGGKVTLKCGNIHMLI